ncbi:MAG: hypothetical protein ACXWEY_01775 [Bacteroidia bacterium]
MKNLGLLYFALFACLSILLTNCKKDLVCTEENTLKVDNEALAYFYYKPGSWWIFQNHDSKAYDSIWVAETFSRFSEAEYDKRRCDCNKDICVEQYFVMFENNDYNRTKKSDTLLNETKIGVSVETGETIVTKTFGGDIFFNIQHTPFAKFKHETFLADSTRTLQVNYIEKINVGGTEYKDVLHLVIYKNTYLKKELWIAKNKYIIKYMPSPGVVWNLVKCNIVQ